MGWATMAEIAYLFGWTESYARRLASRDRWQRKGYAPRMYDIADAGRTASLTSATKQGTK